MGKETKISFSKLTKLIDYIVCFLYEKGEGLRFESKINTSLF